MLAIPAILDQAAKARMATKHDPCPGHAVDRAKQGARMPLSLICDRGGEAHLIYGAGFNPTRGWGVGRSYKTYMLKIGRRMG